MSKKRLKPVFGKYLLLKKIGTGGMAEIFRAWATGAEDFRKLVAIKRILPQLSSEPKFVKMFINEARLTSQLSHSNIVQVYDFGIIDKMLYHAMEYIHGLSTLHILQELSSRDRPPPLGPACFIVKEVLYALDRAHRQRDPLGEPLRIIHRDVTPANILVSYDGEVKIADFGIAKAAMSESHTAAGILKGKIRYMSPEQIHSRTLDQRSDLFSLGVCFYEMLTLHRMYTGKTQFEVLTKAGQADFVRPRVLNDDIPPALEAILLKALAREPEHRYASAAAWRDALERYMADANLIFFRSDLARFMEANFRKLREEQEREMVEEARLTARLGSEGRTEQQIAAALAELEPALEQELEREPEQLPDLKEADVESADRAADPELDFDIALASGFFQAAEADSLSPPDLSGEPDQLRTQTMPAARMPAPRTKEDAAIGERITQPLPAAGSPPPVPSDSDPYIHGQEAAADLEHELANKARTMPLMPAAGEDLGELAFDDETAPGSSPPFSDQTVRSGRPLGSKKKHD
ncbi:MAG: serine/threonine protein kinase [Deltaproteobacteria bacterium]|nr:serine/threonine protein kinase [Deltaproteobacteria bacterium]